jgi:hypothetical protein
MRQIWLGQAGENMLRIEKTVWRPVWLAGVGAIKKLKSSPAKVAFLLRLIFEFPRKSLPAGGGALRPGPVLHSDPPTRGTSVKLAEATNSSKCWKFQKNLKSLARLFGHPQNPGSVFAVRNCSQSQGDLSHWGSVFFNPGVLYTWRPSEVVLLCIETVKPGCTGLACPTLRENKIFSSQQTRVLNM